MPERDVHALQAQALARLAEATQAANDAPDVESALVHLTAATREVLEDKEAHLRPGGLRAGERQFTNSGIFGRRFQLGEGWHSSEHPVHFWNPLPRMPKEADAHCYACTTAYATMIRLCNVFGAPPKTPIPCLH
jgi:hypothetical protein